MAENNIKVRPTLTEMEIGGMATFPIEQMKSIRSQASELGLILNRTYKTKTDRANRAIIVTRTA